MYNFFLLPGCTNSLHPLSVTQEAKWLALGFALAAVLLRTQKKREKNKAEGFRKLSVSRSQRRSIIIHSAKRARIATLIIYIIQAFKERVSLIM